MNSCGECLGVFTVLCSQGREIILYFFEFSPTFTSLVITEKHNKVKVIFSLNQFGRY